METLGEVMSLLARDDVGPVEADRGDLARRLLPTVLKTASNMLNDRKSDRDSNTADNALLVCFYLYFYSNYVLLGYFIIRLTLFPLKYEKIVQIYCTINKY